MYTDVGLFLFDSSTAWRTKRQNIRFASNNVRLIYRPRIDCR